MTPTKNPPFDSRGSTHDRLCVVPSLQCAVTVTVTPGAVAVVVTVTVCVIVNPPFAFTGMMEKPGAAAVVGGALLGAAGMGAAEGAAVGTAGAVVGAGKGVSLAVVCGAGGSTMAWVVLGVGTVTLTTVVEAAAGVATGGGAVAGVLGAAGLSGVATVAYGAGGAAAAVAASGLGTMVVLNVVGTATPVKLRRVVISGVGVAAAGVEASGVDTTELRTWVTVLAVAVGVTGTVVDLELESLSLAAVDTVLAVATVEAPVKLIPLAAAAEGVAIPSVTAASCFLAHCTITPL